MTRLDREADAFEDHPYRTSVRWGILAIVAVFVLAAVVVPLSFLLSWWGTAAKVAGPENVQNQFHGVIEDWNALEAAAGNYCSAKDSKPGPNSPTLVEDPAFAYAAQYRHITVDYNERQANIFEAGVVGPPGYSKTAPSLDEMARKVC